jgi:hypothetical protein
MATSSYHISNHQTRKEINMSTKLVLSDLPSRLLDQIFTFLDAKNLLLLSGVSKELREIAKETANKIISMITHKYYPSIHGQKSLLIFDKSPIISLYELTSPRIIVVRGFITFALNVAKWSWKRCHDTRRDRGYFASVYYKGDIYAIGTYSVVAAGTVERYNPFSDYWSTVTSLPRKLRSVGAAVTANESAMYILGGIESHTEQIVDTIYQFDDTNELHNQRLSNNNNNPSNTSSNNASSTIASDSILPVYIDTGLRLLQPRYRHAAVHYNHCIWIAGGCFGITHHSVTNTVEIFDYQQNIVYAGPSMLVARDFANLLVVENELYAVGGDVDEHGHQTIRTIEKYNANLEKWEHVTIFKDTRRGFSTCAHGSNIYVFNGSNDRNEDLLTWDTYNVQTGIWLSETVPVTARAMPLIDSWGQAVTYPSISLTW